jgi:hypothetical protein
MSRPAAARVSDTSAPFAAATLWRDWRALCETIGERRAGTPGEAQAAAYLAEEFRATGASVAVDTFPCRSLRRAEVQVHARVAGRWTEVAANPLVGAPGTPNGKPVQGEIAWLEFPEGAHRLAPRSLRGKIALVFGPLPTDAETHRRMVAAGPLAVVHIDDRLPFAWTKNDGVYPFWAVRYGMPPTLAVSYLDAWQWRRDGIRELRVRSAVELTAAESQNVVAELPGRRPELPALVLTAHHDTQCNNVGADDNASGVVALLALARALRAPRLERTVRLISFGTEEQLSVGSSAFVQAHPETARSTGLVINFDSIASPLGHWWLFASGSPGLLAFSTRALAARGLDVQLQPELIPFSDHFPFNRVGVPSLWFMRTNFPGGRWQHHSPHDSLDNVSVAEVQRLLAAIHPIVVQLAGAPRWPFRTGLPSAQLAAARRIGRALFG